MDDLTAGAVSQLNQLSLETVDAADSNVSEINFTELQRLVHLVFIRDEDTRMRVNALTQKVNFLNRQKKVEKEMKTLTLK